MSWNYRVVKDRDEKTGEEWYGMCEVYYSEDGKINGITAPLFSVEIYGEFASMFQLMEEALEKKILDKTGHGEIIKMMEPGQW